MSDRTFEPNQSVSVKNPDGSVEAGWRVFTVNEQKQTVILTKEVGSEIESKEVPLSNVL